ncbi:phosphatidylglycerophosphatase A [Thiosulfatimonas sediminis]|uniref:Phosphatidylglycerophosphatase A n=1 Tax=Thiosulfatimonas sediminis TaxID=2675054 RepID=A0A6F8PUN2_9GAMM|nr:phosphatidylglycerophosphatase A [Thiosulfatimonas sediminis]BBP45737.1 phosphatidylglycerophosphatase A [Thiosulfatimonas sediminis]
MSKQKNTVPAPRLAQIIKSPAEFLGYGLGSGLISPAPGTWGTLLGLLLFVPILLWSHTAAWILLLVGLFTGSWICQKSAEAIGVHDHGGIVWDEFIGIWIVLILLPEQSWLWWLVAFISFRFFDILKPWPIGWLDQRLEGGFGIMADDVVAALFAALSIWVLFALFA